jgi:hypothetical protein
VHDSPRELPATCNVAGAARAGIARSRPGAALADHQCGGSAMIDLLVVLFVTGFFAAAELYAAGCDRL